MSADFFDRGKMMAGVFSVSSAYPLGEAAARSDVPRLLAGTLRDGTDECVHPRFPG
ncbi:MAG: hypothetical protein LBS49_09400 [Candidatus Accumulibacter sp.]|nr:hypothetical protein [Accumulibacter sp.]